jgi:hypothetical protein
VLSEGTYGARVNVSPQRHFASLWRSATKNGKYDLLTEQFQGCMLNLTTNPRPPICDYYDNNYPRASDKTMTRGRLSALRFQAATGQSGAGNECHWCPSPQARACLGVERRWCRHATNYDNRSEAFWKGGDAQPLKKRVLQGKLGAYAEIYGAILHSRSAVQWKPEKFIKEHALYE